MKRQLARLKELSLRGVIDLDPTTPTTTVTTERFLKFQEVYKHDPANFVAECLKHGRGVHPYQFEILEMLPKVGRVAVRGPHGIGKTALAAWMVLWAVLTEDDCKVPTTASSHMQLTHFLWPEIHKWAYRVRWADIGRPMFNLRHELLKRSLRRSVMCEAFAAASDRPELIEGAHAKRIAFVYDESKAVRDETFDASEGAFAQAGVGDYEAYALAISTPGEPQGRFYDIHRKAPGFEDWWTRHVTMDEAIAAGQMSTKWVEQRKRQWGVGTQIYKNRVLGEFAEGMIDGVIPLAWIELAQERWHEWQEAGGGGEFTGIGVDVGGGGAGDPSVIAFCYDGCKIGSLQIFANDDPNLFTMQLAGRVKGILDAEGGIAVIDTIGLGAGTYHRLCEQELDEQVHGFVAGARTDHRDISGQMGFVDKRAAGWWIMREMLNPANEFDVCLPPDDSERGLELTGDLTAPTHREMSGAKIRVESKMNVRKRIKRSTDCADAVMHILARQLVQYESPFLGFI